MTIGVRPSLLEIATRAVDEYGAMQKPTELAALLAVARDLDPLTVWEIGTATGGTLWALASVLGAGTAYTSIDLPGGPYGGAQSLPEGDLRNLVRSAGVPTSIPNLYVVRGDSRQVQMPPTELPDLLLIDGDHSEAGVRADWERYAPLVTEGVIALHDILPHPPVSGVEVDRVWAEIVASEASTVEIADRRPAVHGGQWGGWGICLRG